MAQVNTEEKSSVKLAQAIDTLKELIKTRPNLRDANSAKAVTEWIKKYETQEFLGETQQGQKFYKNVKKSFNDATKPIREAFKIIECFYLEAQLGQPKELHIEVISKDKSED